MRALQFPWSVLASTRGLALATAALASTAFVAAGCSAGDPVARGNSATEDSPDGTNPENSPSDAPGTTGSPEGGGPQPGTTGVEGEPDVLPPGATVAPPGSSPSPTGSSPVTPGEPVPDPVMPSAPLGEISTCVDPNAIGPTPIRRISQAEYANTVRDVFGTVVNSGDLPADERVGVFTANVNTPLVRDNFDRYLFQGEQVAAEVVAAFSARSGCASTADAACVTTYLETAARRAFHGTLEDADRTRLAGILSELTALDPNLAVQTAIQWILASPRFIYVVEFGATAGTVAPLSGSEVAGRLAAFLWQSVPDPALLELADSGGLGTADGVKAQAVTMLADPRAVPVLEGFAREWLRVNPALAGATALDQQISAQPGAVMAQAATDPAFSYMDLVMGDSAPVGPELATFYGVTADANGVATLPAERQGLLQSAAFLSSNASGNRPSPVKRGFVIRRSLLCETIPPPADPLAMQLPATGEGVTERDAFTQHSADPTCWVCHKLMDPLGNAFGSYDALGNYNPSLTTTTAGTIYPSEVAFADTAALLNLLATDESAQQCFVTQVAGFALSRPLRAGDGCGIEAVTQAVKAQQMSVQELLIQLAGSSLFTNRNPVIAGGTCR